MTDKLKDTSFKVISDSTVNTPEVLAEGLFTVLICTTKGGYTSVTVDELGEIVKINDVNVKGRLYAL